VVPYYRVPSPGSRPEQYEDLVTLPAADIAENQYFKRDHRRNYPQTAHYDQSTIAGLLLYGSAASPRIAAGNAGTKALAEVQSGSVTLNQALAKVQSNIKGEVLDSRGLPPLPPSVRSKTYTLVPFSKSGMYDESYPVRSFQ
jgi:hypothetical protein